MFKSILPCIGSVLVALCVVTPAGRCAGQVFQQLYSFTDGPDGSTPGAALIQGRDGNFYGTTLYGPGPTTADWLGYGTVFEITPEGELTTLCSFDWTNGAYPSGALLQAADGNFYGATAAAGFTGGSVFKLTPDGQLTTIAWFNAGAGSGVGAGPVGDLAQGPDGKLYGVTHDGGGLFRLSTNGVIENLHMFYDDEPSGGLLLANDGNFYGVAAAGGTCNGNGSIYTLTTNGIFTTVASFCQGPGNAVWPIGKLLQASDGNFYGAAGGGIEGTIFKMTPDGILSTFDRFDYYDGSDPVGGLIQANDGYLYGAANDGGAYPNHGMIFRVEPGCCGCTNETLSPCGNITGLFQLGVRGGWYPSAGLVQGSDGNLYGTTAYGGAYGAGTVFRIIMPGHECQLTCPTNITVCNDSGQCGALVDFGPPVMTNCDGFVLTYSPLSSSFFPVGTNIVSCIAVDPASQPLTNTCGFQVIVKDCEPPVIHSITANPFVFWPPNHKMQPVTLQVSATDNCHVASCRTVSVTSNESQGVPGGASPDWQITGDLSVNLRAERSGNGTGRIYTITVECADDSGNKSQATAQVIVPH